MFESQGKCSGADTAVVDLRTAFHPYREEKARDDRPRKSGCRSGVPHLSNERPKVLFLQRNCDAMTAGSGSRQGQRKAGLQRAASNRFEVLPEPVNGKKAIHVSGVDHQILHRGAPHRRSGYGCSRGVRFKCQRKSLSRLSGPLKLRPVRAFLTSDRASMRGPWNRGGTIR